MPRRRLVEDDEVDVGGAQLLGQLDRMREGTTEAVELGDDELVPLAGDEQGLVELRPAGEGAAGVVDQDPVVPGGGQGIVLDLDVSVAGGDPNDRRGGKVSSVRCVTGLPFRVILEEGGQMGEQ